MNTQIICGNCEKPINYCTCWDDITDCEASKITYTCVQCGKPITAIIADDNGGYCNECGERA